MFRCTFLILFFAFFTPYLSFSQQLPQDTDNIGVPRRMVEVPLKKGEGNLFVLAAGKVAKIYSGWDTIPFNYFLSSMQLQNGLAFVKVQELNGSLDFEPEQTAYVDTYVDTFNLVNIYKDLAEKIKKYGKQGRIADYADNEVVVSPLHQKIMIQKVTAGIHFKWYFESSNHAYSEVTLTPKGELINFKAKNQPSGYNAITLVWHLGGASFGLW